jgi:hypothetical protein
VHVPIPIKSSATKIPEGKAYVRFWGHRVPNLGPLSIAPDIIRLRSWVQDADVDAADGNEGLPALVCVWSMRLRQTGKGRRRTSRSIAGYIYL